MKQLVKALGRLFKLVTVLFLSPHKNYRVGAFVQSKLLQIKGLLLLNNMYMSCLLITVIYHPLYLKP